MARKLPSGTPTRAETYVMPSRDRRPLWAALGLGGILAGLLIVLYFAGVGGALSPGPVSTHHATIGTQCVLCHTTGSAVEDLRCERCHDLEGAGRMTNAAHVLLGSGDARKAARGEAVACLTCHLEHRGRAHAMADVDDRECGRCHEFNSLRSHPEFAARQAQITTGLGLKFPHDRHIVDVRSRTGGDCEACHRPTADLRGFEPISFDLHCASCHTGAEGFVTGKSDALLRDHLLEPARVPPPSSATAVEIASVGPPRFGRADVSRMRHRDPWVMYNVMVLGRSIDPQADAQERAVLASQLAWLERQQRSYPLGALDRQQLQGWSQALETEVETLEQRLATAEAAEDGGTEPLADRKQSVAALADRLAEGQLEPALAADAGDAERQAAARSIEEVGEQLRALAEDAAGQGLEPEDGATVADPEEERQRFERRRQELVSLLEAIGGRGDEGLAERAADLRERAESLEYGGEEDEEGGAADGGTLQARLTALDEVFRVVAQINDPGARLEAARIDLLRGLARQRVGGGLGPDEFEARRSEVLALLDAIEERGGDRLRLRVADLRQRTIAVRAGDAGDEDLRRRLQDRRRLLGRVRLELELEDRGLRVRPVAAGSARDRVAIREDIAAIRDRLAELRRGPRPAALGPDDRAARRESLAALLAPCLKCHELGGAGLAPVRVAEPVMTRAVFDHGPHITQTTCEACHGVRPDEEGAGSGVYASKSASDLNSPGVANCMTCHAPSRAGDDCEVCHRYHPPSISSLLRSP